MAQTMSTDALEEHTRLTAFANAYACGQPIPEALVAAGYSTRSLTLGLSLLRNPVVEDIINTHREWVLSRQTETVKDILQQLDRDRDFAYMGNSPSTALAATMAKAKVLGMLDPTAMDKVPRKITIEWMGENDVSLQTGE
jgi:hypothetical protein